MMLIKCILMLMAYFEQYYFVVLSTRTVLFKYDHIGLKGQLNQNTIVCCAIHKTICNLEAREKNIENYRGTIGKELPTLELMNTYCAIHKVFVSNRDLNLTKKY